jgi:hypothetical protein
MQSTFSGRLTRLPGKTKRELLRLPYIGQAHKNRYWRYVERYKALLPELDEPGQTIINNLEREGCATFRLGQLGLPLDPVLLQSPAHVVHCLENQRCGAPDKRRELFKQLFLWGLQDRLLDVVTCYLGLPPLYLGVGYRRDRADGLETYFRQWHRDPEDYRMVKVFIYLNSVGLDGGPFEYVARASTPEIDRRLGYDEYRCGYVDPRRFGAVVPEGKGVSCVGEFGTVVMADTHNVFHRQRPMQGRDRFSLTYCFTSRSPLQSYGEYSAFRRYLGGDLEQLSEWQKDSLRMSGRYLALPA